MTATEFTPLQSLAGGALIGLAALVLYASVGRIAGVSGIVSRLLAPGRDLSSVSISIAFIIGLLAGVPVISALTGSTPVQSITTNLSMMVPAGLLVGFGAVIGNGCTSGHGVCGISRFSIRSIVATLVFMTTAVATVFVLRHIVGAA